MVDGRSKVLVVFFEDLGVFSQKGVLRVHVKTILTTQVFLENGGWMDGWMDGLAPNLSYTEMCHNPL